ncbi:MAG: DNA-deoxyinosine glycosylase [Bacilli bacterium]|nr:DNA-deoxyinosine glycosylase [Bacilli bacterium]
MKVSHEFDSVVYPDSKVLILGTIPSVKSRESGFYYMHPQNRFWSIISFLFDEDIPASISDKKEFLKKHKIALWDVLNSCDIVGSSDSSIKNPIVNDIGEVIKKSQVDTIFVNGKKAFYLYNKYCLDEVGIVAKYLPSTSPANRSISDEDIKDKYKEILKYLI